MKKFNLVIALTATLIAGEMASAVGFQSAPLQKCQVEGKGSGAEVQSIGVTSTDGERVKVEGTLGNEKGRFTWTAYIAKKARAFYQFMTPEVVTVQFSMKDDSSQHVVALANASIVAPSKDQPDIALETMAAAGSIRVVRLSCNDALIYGEQEKPQ